MPFYYTVLVSESWAGYGRISVQTPPIGPFDDQSIAERAAYAHAIAVFQAHLVSKPQYAVVPMSVEEADKSIRSYPS